MKQKNVYITCKFKYLENCQTIKIIFNRMWLYVADLASLTFFDEILKYFTYESRDNDLPIIPDKIMFTIDRKGCLVTGFDGRCQMDSTTLDNLCDYLKHIQPNGLDSDLLRFIHYFTPKGAALPRVSLGNHS